MSSDQHYPYDPGQPPYRPAGPGQPPHPADPTHPYPPAGQGQPAHPADPADPAQGYDAYQAYGHGQGYQEPAAQTWQGQTWDTQYQPVAEPAAPRQPGGALPMPPEAPAYAGAPGPAAYDDPPTTTLRPVAPAPAPAGPGHEAPAAAGHARMTAAQRARAEGRSPVIEPGMQPAALTALLGILLAAGSAAGRYGLLVPLVLLQAVTAAGWFRLNGMWPARQGIALAFAGGLAADAALLAVGAEHAPAAVLGTLGVWVLLVVVLQLRSHAGADERMYGLMAAVASAALTVVAAGHLAAAPEAVTVGAPAVAVAVLARALPLPGPASVVVALLAAAGAGVAVGGVTGMGAPGALLGLAAGVCALVGHRVAAYDYPSRFVHMTAGVALPLTAAAPAVYLLGRALV
ncbi:hypothetical protein [Streptomyces sp. NPDC050856]|uniref:hypothetical protein n=1 Tax=Streptomyces sp. NPDC050856 TaxID=3154939 RepID=UPI0033E25B1F